MNLANQLLFLISDSLLIPVIVGLILLFGWTLVILGGFVSEYLRRGNHPEPLAHRLSAIPRESADQIGTILGGHEFTDYLEKFVARAKGISGDPLRMEKLIRDLEIEITKELERSIILAKVGPMLGLMGTLIPMGPALTGLAAGDVQQMATNLMIAFSTTVVGLAIAGVCYSISTIRRRWYAQDLGNMELMAHLLSVPRAHPSCASGAPSGQEDGQGYLALDVPQPF